MLGSAHDTTRGVTLSKGAKLGSRALVAATKGWGGESAAVAVHTAHAWS